jgi:hypothetical protein
MIATAEKIITDENVCDELKREYSMRVPFYKKLIRRGEMKQETCDYRLACMRRAIEHYETIVGQQTPNLFSKQ